MDKRAFLQRRYGGEPVKGLKQTAITRSGDIFITADGWDTFTLKGNLGVGTLTDEATIGVDMSDPAVQWVFVAPGRACYTIDSWESFYTTSMNGTVIPDGYTVYPNCVDNSKFGYSPSRVMCAFHQQGDSIGAGYYDPYRFEIEPLGSGRDTRGLNFRTVSQSTGTVYLYDPDAKVFCVNGIRIPLQGDVDTSAVNGRALWAGAYEYDVVSRNNEDGNKLNYWKIDYAEPGKAEIIETIDYGGRIYYYHNNSKAIGAAEAVSMVATGNGLYRNMGRGTIPATGLIPATRNISIKDCAASGKDSNVQSCVASNGYIYTTLNDWQNVRRVESLGSKEWALIVITQ